MAQGDDNIPPANVPPHEAALRLRTIIRDLFKSEPGSGSAAAAIPYMNNADSYYNSFSSSYEAVLAKLSQLDKELFELREIAKLRKPSLITKKVDEIRSGAVPSLRTQSGNMKINTDRMLSNARKAISVVSAPLPDGGSKKEMFKMAYSLVQVLPITPAPPGDRSERTIRAMGAIVKAHYGYFEKELKDVPIDGDLPIIVTQPPIEVIKEVVVEKVQYVLGEDLPPEPWRIMRSTDTVTNDKIMSAQIGMPTNGIGWIHESESKGSVENWNGGNCSFEDAVETLKRCRWRFNSSGNYTLVKGPRRYVIAQRHQKLLFTGAAESEKAVTSDGEEITITPVGNDLFPPPPIVLNMQDVDTDAGSAPF